MINYFRFNKRYLGENLHFLCKFLKTICALFLIIPFSISTSFATECSNGLCSDGLTCINNTCQYRDVSCNDCNAECSDCKFDPEKTCENLRLATSCDGTSDSYCVNYSEPCTCANAASNQLKNTIIILPCTTNNDEDPQCSTEELPTPAPTPNKCEVYNISVEMASRVGGVVAFSGNPADWTRDGVKTTDGDGSNLECVKKIVGSCITTRDFGSIAGLSEEEREKNYEDYEDKNEVAQCDDDIRVYFQKIMNNNRTTLIDKNCNPVTNQDANPCGDLTIRSSSSPISLILNEEEAFKEITLTNFPLHPSPHEKWYTWRASKSLPLVVFDPEKTGMIKDARQLFGEWTFGGKKTAGSDELQPWSDGFEALSQLDLNNDGAVYGKELKDLSLWFDENRDGISQKGEVKDLLSEGIINLYYKDAKIDKKTGDIYSAIGYERYISGNLEIGRTVDWYGEAFDSKQEALVRLKARNNFVEEIKNQTVEDHSKTISHEDIDEIVTTPPKTPQVQGISGAWLWKMDEPLKGDNGIKARQEGILIFKQNQNILTGTSIVELLLKNPDEARSMIISYLLKGQILKEVDGTQAVNFTLQSKTDKTSTIAKLSEDGLILKGQTTQTTIVDGSKLTMSYSWTANRFDRNNSETK